MNYFKPMVPPVQIVRLDDPTVGLDGIIVIHSMRLGPGAGGCRFWNYPTLHAATEDAVRLAKGMSYKNALAGLPFGGAKAVIRRPEGPFDRHALFRAFGREVRKLDGCYVTAEDVGTTVEDMEQVARETAHVAGLKARPGLAGGDPSPWTALGVFTAMKEAARTALGAELGDLTVAVQGTGNVGGALCGLLAQAGAKLVLADVDPKRREVLARVHDARVVGVDEIARAPADIFAPCALGGAITPEVVLQMKARLVCGGANNQLASDPVAELLRRRGITYAPDYVVNAGGIINVVAEYLREDADTVASRIAQIGPRIGRILQQADRESVSPAAIADQMAEQLIASVELVPA